MNTRDETTCWRGDLAAGADGCPNPAEYRVTVPSNGVETHRYGTETFTCRPHLAETKRAAGHGGRTFTVGRISRAGGAT